ncbi:MAG: replicative DNA helicase, partial [Clostridia bacterium]|nr:replicative DNA helicase [Clostridia bacterium]
MEEKLNPEYGGFERAMPFSREAELSVLGAMLLDMQCIPDVISLCRATDFYIERNKELFEAIVDLYNLGKPIDIVTIKQQLTIQGVLEAVGGLDFVMEAMSMVPTTNNVKHYAEIVAQKALLRRIIKISEKAMNDCYKGDEEADSVIGEMEQKLIDISQERSSKGPVHLRTYLGQTI